MLVSSQKLKEKMLEFTRLFLIERSCFQRFVIVYKYIRFLNKDPLAKDVLQKIFNDTAKIIGYDSLYNINEEQFLNVKGEAIFSREFWIYYTNLEIIHGNMKRVKECNLTDKKDIKQLYHLFSKPYSHQMLELSFKVINSEIFERLDKDCFLNCDNEDNKIYFDEIKNILYIKGMKVKIATFDKITNAKKILHHIFITNKNDLKDDFYYAEIADEEFGELEYNKNNKAWEKYHDTCKYINKIVEKQTKKEIKKFLVYNTGKKGRVKINEKII